MPSKLIGDAPSAEVAFRPWSHTDRRQMLTLVTVPEDTRGQPGRLVPATEENWMRALRDEPRVVITPGGPPRSAYRFVAVSWSLRSPQRLRVHSIRMVQESDAQQWAEFIRDTEGKPGREFFVLELLSPETAAL